MPKAMPPRSSTSTQSDLVTPGVAANVTFDDAMAELDGLVKQMESGDLPLESLLEAYQRGADLMQLCRNRLKSVEDQIKVLDDGVLKPWKAQ
jgi:exodeoxyribonuclease VII small subunit